MILYIENPIEHTHTQTHTHTHTHTHTRSTGTNKLSKVTGHKTNTQISVFLCISKKQSVKEIKKTISFTIASRWIKCLGGNKFNQGGESLIKLQTNGIELRVQKRLWLTDFFFLTVPTSFVSVSQGWLKVPQTGWLKTTELWGLPRWSSG